MITQYVPLKGGVLEQHFILERQNATPFLFMGGF